jgi:hypothetical protein
MVLDRGLICKAEITTCHTVTSFNNEEIVMNIRHQEILSRGARVCTVQLAIPRIDAQDDLVELKCILWNLE